MNGSSFAAKIRPVVPGGSRLPDASRIATFVPGGGVPAVSGRARRSAGVAIVTQDASVDPYRL